jgi:hypothetical protein
MTDREPTEEMILAGIAAANRQMPYINDAQKVLAIWKAMQARATPALPQGVEEWIAANSEYADKVYERHAKFQSMKKYLAVDDLMKLLSGMAIVPVETQKDAERYRFIRMKIGYDRHGVTLPCGNTKGKPEETDAAIDAAMLAAAKEKQS